jgi:2-polyprenyl-6-methoxyphenol hydroxylase-like FAD-dependent oxidoreductase
MQVTVIGTGYAGTVTGACLSYLGHHVTCVDTDAAKIETLQRGGSPSFATVGMHAECHRFVIVARQYGLQQLRRFICAPIVHKDQHSLSAIRFQEVSEPLRPADDGFRCKVR